MENTMRMAYARTIVSLLSVMALSVSLRAQPASAPTSQDRKPYSEVFYSSGSLRIEAYLYRPAGAGPFPVIIYNHGSRDGYERAERPFEYIGSLLTAAGYAVLVPERRGYGKSDGETFRDEVGADHGARFIGRLKAESDDVLAAIEYLKTVPSVDMSRVGMMGWSFGGIVSVFAASRSERIFAVVDQAGGSLSWSRSRELQSALPRAAAGIRVPILCMAAANDATTDSVRSVCDAAKSSGASASVTIFPAFTPPHPAANIAPGHLIFSAQGVSHWGQEVVTFFNEHRPR
jgi:dienelactone hydrolase